MQLSQSVDKEITQYYTTAIDALYTTGRALYTAGKLEQAQNLLRLTLQLLEASQLEPQYRLKLLLLYGQVLAADHILTRGSADLMFSTIECARQIAEGANDQQGISDALSLLGQARCFATTVACLQSGISPFSIRGQGKYDNVLDEALTYQQHALALREDLRDIRGVSESYFQIGFIYERWQQYEEAQTYYAKARQIAEQSGLLFEKTEPARHVALHALRKGELDLALTLALQALQLREEAGFKPYQPLDHLLLRDIYIAKGEPANAQHHSERATSLAEEMQLTNLVSSIPDIRGILTSPHQLTRE